MSLDITSTLLSKGVSDVSLLNAAVKKYTETTAADSVSNTKQAAEVSAETLSEVKSDFKEWLEEETDKLVSAGIDSDTAQKTVSSTVVNSELSGVLSDSASRNAQLTEMTELIDSLDRSILGSVASSLDPKDVASDLLSGDGADRVIDRLVSGHMSSIVMSGSDDSENADDSLESSVKDSLGDLSTETLAQNLETIMEHLNQISG